MHVHISRVLAVVTEMRAKISVWLLLMDGYTDFVHSWVVEATELESSRSVIN